MRREAATCRIVLGLLAACVGCAGEHTLLDDDAAVARDDAWVAPDAFVVDSAQTADAAVVDSAYAPDAASPPTDAARADTGSCGDHVVDAWEVCDDGNRVGGDGCRADCLGNEVCGDGLVDVGELCLPSIATASTPIAAMGFASFGSRLMDLDGDGDVDVLQALLLSFDPGGVTIYGYLNDGNGTLAAAYDTGGRPSQGLSLLMDLDGDGASEYVVSPDSLEVLRNDGAGLFPTPAATTALAGSSCTPPAPGDFDGDGDVDLVVAENSLGTVALLSNDGHGVFSAGGSFAAGASPCAVLATDFDGDGRPDVLAFGYAPDSGIRLLRGAGGGAFAPFESAALGGSAGFAHIGDLDADGDGDVLVSVGTASSLVVIENARGSLGAQTTLPITVYVVDLADVDADEAADALVGETVGGVSTASIRLGDRHLGLGAVAWNAGASATPIGLADMNGDGALDVIVSGAGIDVYLADP